MMDISDDADPNADGGEGEGQGGNGDEDGNDADMADAGKGEATTDKKKSKAPFVPTDDMSDEVLQVILNRFSAVAGVVLIPGLTSVRFAAIAVAAGRAVGASVYGKLLGPSPQPSWEDVTSSYIDVTIARQMGRLKNFPEGYQANDMVGEIALSGKKNLIDVFITFPSLMYLFFYIFFRHVQPRRVVSAFS